MYSQKMKKLGRKYYTMLQITNSDVHVHPNNKRTQLEIYKAEILSTQMCMYTPKTKILGRKYYTRLKFYQLRCASTARK
jgi:hypothetical protein